MIRNYKYLGNQQGGKGFHGSRPCICSWTAARREWAPRRCSPRCSDNSATPSDSVVAFILFYRPINHHRQLGLGVISKKIARKIELRGDKCVGAGVKFDHLGMALKAPRQNVDVLETFRYVYLTTPDSGAWTIFRHVVNVLTNRHAPHREISPGSRDIEGVEVGVGIAADDKEFISGTREFKCRDCEPGLVPNHALSGLVVAVSGHVPHDGHLVILYGYVDHVEVVPEHRGYP